MFVTPVGTDQVHVPTSLNARIVYEPSVTRSGVH